jgi:hypothetical protein
MVSQRQNIIDSNKDQTDERSCSMV